MKAAKKKSNLFQTGFRPRFLFNAQKIKRGIMINYREMLTLSAFLCALFIFSASALAYQRTRFGIPSCPATTMITCPPQIGDKAPSFVGKSTHGTINFPEDYKGKWVIFFSHPADFTPVCETEFKRLAALVPEFEKLNTQLLGLSVDSTYMHQAWEASLEEKGSKKIKFPIVGDLDKTISAEYGMIHPHESTDQTVRAVFFIDPYGIIRAIFYYPRSSGRSFTEVLRLLQSLQVTDKTGDATPSEWQPGKPTISKKDLEVMK